MRRALNRLASLSGAMMLAAATAAAGSAALAQGELNLYSSRHYDTDERLYSDFTEQTGIKINRIEADASALIQRIKSEGQNSPADVLITVDAGRLWAAEQDGLFQPVDSTVIEEKVPAELRHPEGLWFGMSQRARVIFYHKGRVEDPPQTYEALADPKYKGRVCTRSGSNIYMLSLLASIIEHKGEEAAKEWAKGLWENRAREPEGGDTDQLRAIVSGECDIVISNTYYFARALRTDVNGLTGQTDQIGVVFPNQDTTGTHVNISGIGLLANAPNKENAVKFMEYLVSTQAQEYFAAGNDEYPVVDGVAKSASVQQLGDFKADELPLIKLGQNQATAQKIYDEVGYK